MSHPILTQWEPGYLLAQVSQMGGPTLELELSDQLSQKGLMTLFLQGLMLIDRQGGRSIERCHAF